MNRPAINLAQIVVLIVLLVTAVGMSAAINAYGFNLRKKAIYPEDGRTLIASLPRETHRWIQQGPDRTESAEVIETLGTTNYINRTFIRKPLEGQRGPRHIVELHAAYYTNQIDTVPHVPDRCLIGGGWTMSQEMREIDLPLNPDLMFPDLTLPRDDTRINLGQQGELFTMRLPMNPDWTDAPGRTVRLPRDVGPGFPLRIRYNTFSPPGSDVQFYAGYFFIANGGFVASATGVRTLAFDLKNDYAFYMKVQVSTASASSDEEYAQICVDLLEDILPELMRCVPDWAKVEMGQYPADNPANPANQN